MVERFVYIEDVGGSNPSVPTTHMLSILEKLYIKVISKHRGVTSFIILISFVLTFIAARLTIYLIDANVVPDFYASLGQTHIHHLNYGIFLLSISGYLSLIFHQRRIIEKLAIMYGVGLGLTFDEFSLWLHLQNNYYARISYEAIVVIGVILINIVYFGEIWKKVWRHICPKF